MASIFTYQDEPHRVHSPWSTPGSSTPQIAVTVQGEGTVDGVKLGDACRLAKLEPEKHDGPIEYKLHLLLRWRRTFTYSSTAIPVWSNSQNRLETASASSVAADGILPKATYQPSTQTRQARLQQLTTQLLWRLQQSSPFHSSSNKNLVLPILPEATPRLGVPDRPAKLLPGLEESQGALYEIGVADDGTLVGLADEELEESLTNLRAMAASLGCVVDIHRRVVVGDCEWVEDAPDGQQPVTRSSKLWVAEVLVRPDNKSVEIVTTDSDGPDHLDLRQYASPPSSTDNETPKQYMRVAILGTSSSGKSSLLGTLTNSVLDDGRGKSRLSLLKHRHEIASGITSSVAQELLGYDMSAGSRSVVINYASGDVSSWPDIHNLADRLLLLSDSPGLPRYSKSTFRALISWKPAWTMLCIPADDPMQGPYPPSVQQDVVTEEPNLSVAHFDLCVKLDRPFIVSITKMDRATKMSLRQVLGQLLSRIRSASKEPLLLNTAASQHVRKHDVDFSSLIDDLVTEEQAEIREKFLPLGNRGLTDYIPIVMTSALSGSGIPILHALLRSLPATRSDSELAKLSDEASALFRTDEVFAIPPSKVYSTTTERIVTDSGVVLCGVVHRGTISLGDELLLGPFLVEAETGEPLHIRALRRASSHHAKPISSSLPRSLSETFSKSLQLNSCDHELDSIMKYAKVRVVSLRNLRLPVSTLLPGDTGTVGIQSFDGTIPLNKARKGMILTRIARTPRAFRSFTAHFPYSDFEGSGSPPLILGGHAIAYIHSIRASVKVIGVALEDESKKVVNTNGAHDTEQASPHDEVFTFDDDHIGTEEDEKNEIIEEHRPAHLRLSFKFVSTVEYLEVGDQVLVVPNTSTSGPVVGPTAASTIAGFSGFVGNICEAQA